jgi:hypothetical protein
MVEEDFSVICRENAGLWNLSEMAKVVMALYG